MNRVASVRLVTLAAAFLPATASAHSGVGSHGSPFLSGLAHPLLGADHLLAMVAVGLLAAMSGGRAFWAYPAAFLGAMALGGLIGFGGIGLPVIEPTILASVVVLGAAVAFAVRPPLALACGVIAAFGLAHGYAHGLEGPVQGGLTYAAGFVIATSGLHLLGLGAGLAAGGPRRLAFARALGGLTGLAGVALILG